jgi:hypothetical protein
MRLNSSITFNVLGQTLSYRVLEGRPTAATFDVFRDYMLDNGTAEFSGTATIDSVNTTVSATSGAGQADPQKLSLTSTAAIVVGTKYLLVESQKTEWVEPVEVTATYIRCRHPIASSFTTSATLVGTKITAAVNATWVTNLAKMSNTYEPAPDFRVRWAYTVAGVALSNYSFFDLVRQAISHHVDIDDINARAPGLRDKLPIEYQTENGRPLVDAAWRCVRADLYASKLSIDAMRDSEGLDELVILRALTILGEGGWAPPRLDPLQWAALKMANYERFFEKNYGVTLARSVAQEQWGLFEHARAEPVWSK